jgi:hypothetical protein
LALPTHFRAIGRHAGSIQTTTAEEPERNLTVKRSVQNIVLLFVLSCADVAIAQDVVHDVKKAGVDTERASAQTGRAIGKGSKAAVKGTGHDIKVGSKETAYGTNVVAKDTAKGTETVAKDTAHGTKTSAKKVTGQ